MQQQKTARPTSAPVFRCEADVLEGLEPYAVEELQFIGRDALRTPLEQAPGVLRFGYAGKLGELLDLRSVVAVYLVERFNVPRPKALLGHQHFEALVKLLEHVQSLWPERTFQTLRFNAAGDDTSVLTRLKEALAARAGLAVAQEKSDGGDLLVRLRRGEDGAWEALVRLSPFPLSARPWRVCNMPGALNATVAHVLMGLTVPQPSDNVLNMACGSGTLLIERMAFGRPQSAVGCDTDGGALNCARANLAAAGYADAVRIEAWDAGRLPLPNKSMDVVCADLPFGQLIGSHRVNEKLYPRAIAEATRVARPGARMALVTHEIRLLEHALAAYTRQWQLDDVVRVRTGGMAPQLFLLRRVDDTQ